MKLVTIWSTRSESASPTRPARATNVIATSPTSLEATGAKRAVQLDDQLHPSLDQQNRGELKNHNNHQNIGLWSSQRLSYAIPAGLLAIVTLTAILAYVIIKRRRKTASATLEPTREQPVLTDSPQFTAHLTTSSQQPNTDITSVQTNPIDISHTGIKTEVTQINAGQKSRPITIQNPCTGNGRVMRMKTMGLLERRGSNASLTIDVNPIVMETFHLPPTPPKECSAVEYLASASNRMNRKQLQACVTNTKALHEEFLDIPLNHPKKPDLPGCSNKNRYKTIWPNESTRVQLPRRNRQPLRSASLDEQSSDQTRHVPQRVHSVQQEPTSNRYNPVCTGSIEEMDEEDVSSMYINANYIAGYDNNPKAFIATQGPLVNTIDDLWLMVWQERAPCVVMMTKLQENQKVKCEPYLPISEGRYGDIRVVVIDTVEKNGYSVRTVQLNRNDESREIKHFWFAGWPDHKAPSSTAKQLIELVQDVESIRQKGQSIGDKLDGPVVVHCSAGLGRTGCFIATTIGMQQLQIENAVDILGIVCQLRMERGGMIQTVEQYEFLHHVLVEYERHLPETPDSAPSPPVLKSTTPPDRRNGTHEVPSFWP